MVVLGEGLFLMGKVPLYQALSAVQRFLADTRVAVRDAALAAFLSLSQFQTRDFP
jgi:hypothetical protein